MAFKISDLLGYLQKAQQYAGDATVILHDLEAGAEHELLALNVHLPANGDPTVSLEHGPAPAQPAPSEPTDPNATPEQPVAPAA